MQTLTFSDETISHLRQAASLRGLDANTYAEELLAISLAVLKKDSTAPEKRHCAIEFSAIAPSGRAASEIDADIEVSRAEWDSRMQPSAKEKATS